MRRTSSWAARIALIAAATSGVVAACYDDVPAPSAPLPPTREVKPLGPRPKPVPLKPVPTKPTVIELKTEVQSATPAHDAHDAGVLDIVDLPPVPDASGLDSPLDKK
ncbi:MAG TPA: hypothetical protein VIV11_21145 [Kofleriaceae bacterium]